MNAKKKWADIRSAGDAKSEFSVKDGVRLSQKKIKIYLFNHENRSATEYKHLKKSDYSNRAIINLEFVPELGEGIENEKEILEYLLTNPNPKSKTEQNKLKKEAYTNYIINNVNNNNILNDSRKCSIDDILCEMKKTDDGKIILELSKEGEAGKIKIGYDKIEIKADFYLIEKITDEELIPYTEPKKPFLTKKTIIISAILVLIIALIFFFRKKIWKWIKGETEQEKKVNEQLDIF